MHERISFKPGTITISMRGQKKDTLSFLSGVSRFSSTQSFALKQWPSGLPQALGSLGRLVKTQMTWLGPQSFLLSSSVVAEHFAFLASHRVMLVLFLWHHTGRTAHLGSSHGLAPGPIVAAER
ncbi:hypothetical protein HJG60_010698 [Phyllostomus discolor]|uniref:Uncharacterized protein n=1 Tax=Phyllostomus discolor TaxID=89673 RepID=A0A834APW1_9CHIR|nr:hypothetical protein HJG60_010698 [Phyllostomus discolor]